jgi:UDP:flavonoid glycosyltransferase YjiC (YdhE family)
VTGAWLDRSDPALLSRELEGFLADGAAPIIMTFGSMAGAPDLAVTGAIERLLHAGRRIVVQEPGTGLPSSPNLIALREPIDHRALFPRAACVVHHGGAGTTHAACAAGVPSVVVPHVGDQRYWGDRLHRLGVAPEPQLVARLEPTSLADAALAAATDPAMRAAAATLGDRIAREDGLEEAVRLLERVSL